MKKNIIFCITMTILFLFLIFSTNSFDIIPIPRYHHFEDFIDDGELFVCSLRWLVIFFFSLLPTEFVRVSNKEIKKMDISDEEKEIKYKENFEKLIPNFIGCLMIGLIISTILSWLSCF